MTGSRQEKEKAFRRSYIADAAEALFHEKGFDGATMDQLAAAAELSKSTLYVYFQSKDELLFYMHLRDARIGFRVLEEGVAAGGSGIEQLEAYGNAFYSYYEQHPPKLLLRSYLDLRGVDPNKVSADLREENAAHRQKEIDLLEGIIRAGIDDGTISPGLDVPMTMVNLVYALHPIAKQSLFPTHNLGDFPGSSCYDAFLKLFLRGVAVRAATKETS